MKPQDKIKFINGKKHVYCRSCRNYVPRSKAEAVESEVVSIGTPSPSHLIGSAKGEDIKPAKETEYECRKCRTVEGLVR